MFLFCSFLPKILLYCVEIAPLSQTAGLGCTSSPKQVFCPSSLHSSLFYHSMKIAAHQQDTLCSISFQTPFSTDSKTLRTVQTLRYFLLSQKLTVPSFFPPLLFSLPHSLGVTIKPNGNSQLSWVFTVKYLQKTRWGSFCNLVPHSNSGLSLLPWHWAGLQMLHFIPYLLCDFGTQIPCFGSFVLLIHAVFSSLGSKNDIFGMCLNNTWFPTHQFKKNLMLNTSWNSQGFLWGVLVCLAFFFLFSLFLAMLLLPVNTLHVSRWKVFSHFLKVH